MAPSEAPLRSQRWRRRAPRLPPQAFARTLPSGGLPVLRRCETMWRAAFPDQPPPCVVNGVAVPLTIGELRAVVAAHFSEVCGRAAQR